MKTTLKLYDEIETKTTPKPKPIMNRKSRVMKTDDKSKTTKQFIKKPILKTLDDNQVSVLIRFIGKPSE